MTKKSIKMFDTSPMLRSVLSKGLMTAIICGGAVFSASAQCTVPTVTDVATTAATCPGNGVINIDATGGPSLQYSILSGPTSVSGSNSSGDFLSMAAGTYVVRVYNPEEGGCFTDTTVTIANNYTPFSFTASVSDVCVGATAGTINVSTTTGSSTPLQIAYWQGVPAESDASLTYGTALTHSVPETAFGTWNVRVKDACGEAITQQVNVANLYPDGLTITSAGRNYVPSTCAATDPNIDIWIHMESSGTWVTASSLPSAGVEVSVYSASAAAPCDLGAATFINTQTVNPTTGDVINVPRASRLIFVLTTPCGGTGTYCYNGVADQNPGTSLSLTQSGCPTAASPDGTITLNAYANDFMIPPVDYVILNSAGDTVGQSVDDDRSYTISSGILYGETYTSYVTDACGETKSASITAPAAGTPITATIVTESRAGCTNEEGLVTARVSFEGHFPGLAATATTFEIMSGPNAGRQGVRSSSRSIWFFNLVPGSTNPVRIINPDCPDTAYTSFNVGTSTTGLIQNVSLAAAQLCDPTGPGKGTLAFTANYNGAGWGEVKIYKAGTAAAIYTGPPGSSTLPGDFGVGKYYAVFGVLGTTVDGYTCSTVSVVSDTVEIVASGSLPTITKKVPMVCENPVGTPTEAKLALQITGASPFAIEYKEEGTTTWNTWTGTTGSELITGLTPGITYNLSIRDNCGATTTENATMGTLGSVSFENTQQPCIGESFTILAPRYANSTYSWEKDGVALSSTTNQIVIPVFSEANTGTYTCEIVIDNCLIRTAVITLYSQMCDSTLGTLSIAGNVFADGNGMSDDMVNGVGTNAGGVLYAALTNSTGMVMGSVPVNADGTYTFNNLAEGDYKVVIMNGKPAGGSTATAGTLPTNWVNTGDNIGLPTIPGSGATIDGVSETITLATSNISNVNFGVNERPESFDKTQNVTGAPVVGVPVVLTQPLTGSDKEDTNDAEVTWDENPIVITSLPTNGFDLVYNGTTLELGDTIRNYNPALLSVVPTASTPNGTDETSFEYATVDSANAADLTPATYQIIFSEPLPVSLIAFDAVKKNNTALLTWTTGTERNNKGFEVLRSTNGSQWAKIGFVATASTDGNSNAKLNYSFSDAKPFSGSNHYRLKQVDIDGASEYSEVRVLDFASTQVISLQPNPAKQAVTISGLNGNENLRIFDATGRLVKEVKATNTNMQISLDGLAEGTYQVNIYNNNAVVSTQKLVIVR